MKLSLFQTILMGVFAAGALLGIIVFSTYSGKKATDTVGTVVVWGELPAAQVSNALAAITQVDKTLKGLVYIEHGANTIQSDLVTAVATGKAPDLVLFSQEDLLSLAKVLQPIPSASLSSAAFQGAFIQEGRLFSTSAGAYAVPFLVDPLVLYSNQDILASEGIVKPPSSWEEVSALISKIANISPAGGVTRALIPLGTYANVHDARGILSALFLQENVPVTVVGGSGLMSADFGGRDSQNGEPAGQAVLRFYTAFADPTKASYTWNTSLPDSAQAFLNGDVALYIGYASEAAYLKEANPNRNFVVSPLPQPGTASGKTTYGLLYAFAIPSGARNPGGAFQAAALLSNSSQQQASALATGLAPASLTALQKLPGDPIRDVAYTSALYAKGWLSPAGSDTDQVFSSMIQNVISGKLPIGAALLVAQRSLTALLQ